MDRYLRGRRSFSNREVPMVEAMSQRHLFYHKGAVVMYTLREMIGEEPLSLALRRFYAKHAGRRPPCPTSLDLVAELRSVTPDSLQPLITDLFETITLWDVRTDTATAERVGDEWRVTLAVTAKKVRADSIGKETEVPMNDLAEIGVFAEGNAGERRNPLYLRKHRVRSGRQTIVVTVPADSGAAPARAGIDPHDKLIVRERQRTVVRVRSAGSG